MSPQPTNVASVLRTNNVDNFRERFNTVVTNTNQLYYATGNTDALQTTSKTITSAINELYADVGDVSDLFTQPDNGNVVSAINYISEVFLGNFESNSIVYVNASGKITTSNAIISFDETSNVITLAGELNLATGNLVLPLTTTASPKKGSTRYDDSSDIIYVWDGSTWQAH